MNKSESRHRLFYDEDDYQLLEIVNKILAGGKNPTLLRKLFDPSLHPRGIKELAAPRSLRIASAIIDLLGTLDHGTANERLTALRAVRAESLHESSQALRLNVARVLLQIMKQIVRAGGHLEQQLALAHDFREASSGKSRLIRKQLRKYHLLEMPEAWNQLAFDHHIHDANTKGRKSPTHLIMDAWIKGIRFLGVIYYNNVKPEVAAELLEAADIMGIDVRIGIEVSARLRNKYVQLIWAPRGFLGRDDFLRFLNEPEVRAFLAQGQAVVEFEKDRVLELLQSFNQRHLPAINAHYDLAVPALDEEEFLTSVGCGQASLVHLAEFAHSAILPHLQRKTEEFSKQYLEASSAEQERVRALVESFNQLDPETLVENYLRPDVNPDVPDLRTPVDNDDAPEMLRLTPSSMFNKLERLPCRSRITINPSGLSPADVLEVLYAGKGRVTHLEIFNLKDWSQGRTQHRHLINEMRLVINRGNVVEAKRMVRQILACTEEDAQQEGDEAACEKIRIVLRDLKTLLKFYSVSRLRSRLGSDSIGHSRQTRGMGLVVAPTLPWRAQREIRRDPNCVLPVTTVAQRHIMLPARGRNPRKISWSVGHNSTTIAKVGNIATLGGKPDRVHNNLFLPTSGVAASKTPPSLNHLNSGFMNTAKVLLGFLPAFLTFYLTKEWWVLAYFGAVIWFAITGFRNILQSVVGGGGFRRSSLLGWRDLVSWNRVADSLLFTGFSVPLLDFLVKDLFLARSFDVTTTTNPLLLYSVMALANGIYISSHNTYRGLPLGAVVGNFFRTILSIPVALGLNMLILHLITSAGVSTAVSLAGMQLWAAVISKAASDLVAALIEGTADRRQNLAYRRMDYAAKLGQVYDVYGRLETMFPEQDVLTLLQRPKDLVKTLSDKNAGLLRDMVIHSLDLLYFWMYQARARITLCQLMEQMSSDEKQFLLQSQQVLKRKRIISEMLLHGLVGKRFEGALAFYLSHSDAYLRMFARLADEPIRAPSSI
ncbi:MAG: hypothetical protein JRH20_16745 [Deltaproteobacteria bacterium]|nr:hypothetical protein [Deltaproteobacteria bacterium]